MPAWPNRNAESNYALVSLRMRDMGLLFKESLSLSNSWFPFLRDSKSNFQPWLFGLHVSLLNEDAQEAGVPPSATAPLVEALDLSPVITEKCPTHLREFHESIPRRSKFPDFHKALGFEPISRFPCSWLYVWLWMFAGLLGMKVSSISFKPVEFSGPLKVRQLRWRSAEESWKLGIWEYHFIIPCSAKKHCVSVYGVQCYPYSVLIILFLYPCFRI